MLIPIKNQKEIAIMRQGGKLLARVMKEVMAKIIKGVSTLELDQLAEKLILKAGAKPAFKGFIEKGRVYPATLCTSINHQLVHGVPLKEQIVQNSDIISLDCGLKYQGYFTDMAVTLAIGQVSSQVKELIKVTKNSLDLAIKKIKSGVYLGDISAVIQTYVEKNNFSVVRDLSGHGIGRKLHEPPSILNYGQPGTGPKLESGMVLAIEPMVNVGDWKIKVADDGWTVVTADHSLSAHFEHTILVTKDGAEVLTKL
ncbi:type I methionyl aminopeptidase [Patescibacteria group bacterium]|nr:type I methionyl aminopeptidase [Patescibacteria group bacterium]